jgi:predicted DNA-binding protein (MmcQ/YjbR family)
MARNDAKAVRARLIQLALGLPGAFEDHPWGETVAKVGGKVFVFFGTGESQDQGFGFCAKLPASGSVATMLPFVEPAGYGLGKSGWVYVKFTGGELPVAMFEEWILESYRAVAPKKLAKMLDASPTPEPTRAKEPAAKAKKPAAKAKKPAAKAKKPAAKAKKPAAKAKKPAAKAKRPVSKAKAKPASR